MTFSILGLHHSCWLRVPATASGWTLSGTRRICTLRVVASLFHNKSSFIFTTFTQVHVFLAIQTGSNTISCMWQYIIPLPKHPQAPPVLLMMNKALNFMFLVVKHFRQILYCTRDESTFNLYQATSFPYLQGKMYDRGIQHRLVLFAGW